MMQKFEKVEDYYENEHTFKKVMNVLRRI